MEHAPLIGTINVTLAMPPAVSPAASALFGALLSAAKEPTQAQAVAPKRTPPAIGEYWPGQGGIYGGIRQYPEGLCHVIFAAQDAGNHAYGEHGTEAAAISRHDGKLNTDILIAEGGHPAAEAARAYTADGNSDFYLPAIAELNHAWACIPEAFEPEWYWSSSQRSAYTAFIMYFADGSQNSYGKYGELRVRPVRRFLQ
nr:DUF1566 domain-containing protein [uncultured Pseudomonas sp.]